MHSANLYGSYGNIESEMAYMARVSTEQHSGHLARFFALRLCERHWSVFDMHTIKFEIVTSLAIAQQLTRHNSLRFQVLSQRYADVSSLYTILAKYINSPYFVATYQPDKTFAPKIDITDEEKLDCVREVVLKQASAAYENYRALLAMGVSYETARSVLPTIWPSKLYASGTVRNWLTYLSVRLTEHTQIEHRILAHRIAYGFKQICPNVYNGAIKAGILPDDTTVGLGECHTRCDNR